MKTEQLKTDLALTLVKSTDERIMAAGPLTRQPGTLPYRVVMVNWGHKLSVHTQYFSSDVAHDGDLAVYCENLRNYLENGDYFGAEELVKCIERFAERCKKHAEFAQSIFRGISEAA